MFKIGEMAKLNHISIQTLRWYDQEKLFEPAVRDEKTGYRYYTLSQCPKLDMIQFLRSLDFGINEIKNLMAASDIFSELNEALDSKQAELDLLTVRIQQQKRLLSDYRFAQTVIQGEKLDNFEPIFADLPQRQVLTHQIRGNIYEMDEAQYELSLHEMKDFLAKNNVAPYYYERVGSIMAGTVLTGNAPLFSNTLFVVMDGQASLPTKVIPAGHYLITYCNGFSGEKAAIQRLQKVLATHHCRVNGDYLCEVLTEAPNLTSDRREMLLRLQVPVEELS